MKLRITSFPSFNIQNANTTKAAVIKRKAEAPK